MTTSNEVTELVFQNELTEQGLKDLREKYPSELIVDMSIDSSFKDARKIRTERNKLTDAINRRRLDVTKELKDHGDSLIKDVNSIYDVIVAPFEIEDQRRKEVEAAKKRELEERIAKERTEIAGIKNFLNDAGTASSEEISSMLDAVGNIDATDFHKDLIHEAMETIKEVKSSLTDLMVSKIESERLAEEHRIAEEARIAAEEEAARIQKEADEKAEKIRLETEAREKSAAFEVEVNDRISKLKMIPMDVMGEPAEIIGRKISSITRVEITEENFSTRYEEALAARETVLDQLGKMFAQAEMFEALTVKDEPIAEQEQSVEVEQAASVEQAEEVAPVETMTPVVEYAPDVESAPATLRDDVVVWANEYLTGPNAQTAFNELSSVLTKHQQ